MNGANEAFSTEPLKNENQDLALGFYHMKNVYKSVLIECIIIIQGSPNASQIFSFILATTPYRLSIHYILVRLATIGKRSCYKICINLKLCMYWNMYLDLCASEFDVHSLPEELPHDA